MSQQSVRIAGSMLAFQHVYPSAWKMFPSPNLPACTFEKRTKGRLPENRKHAQHELSASRHLRVFPAGLVQRKEGTVTVPATSIRLALKSAAQTTQNKNAVLHQRDGNE